jgi:hypothetical protein
MILFFGIPVTAIALVPILHEHFVGVFLGIVDGVSAMLGFHAALDKGVGFRQIKRVVAGVAMFFR